MSRKITTSAINAFMNGSNFKSSNTEVKHYGNVTDLLLYGNKIAQRDTKDNSISITTCGWQSNTTKERLNALPGVRINQKAGVWYLNGKEWNGKLTNIK